MLDHAEDPEKMINMMIREMEDTIVELKSTCATSIAEHSKIEREVKDEKELAERWEIRARLAVEKEKNELAKEALIEKKKAEHQLELAENDLKQLDQIIAENKKNIAELDEKLETVKQKKRILVQRAVHAQEKKRAQETLRKTSGADAAARFDELENRIERMEADADLAGYGNAAAKEDEFFRMEKESEIEKELAELKAKMKKAEE
jgi:phage shock protein A